jgi:hypothetical protein
MLYERLKSENRLIDPVNWKTCTLFDLNFRPRNMTAQELRAGFRNLAVKLYSDEFTQWRRDTFRKNLRRTAGGRKTNQGLEDAQNA